MHTKRKVSSVVETFKVQKYLILSSEFYFIFVCWCRFVRPTHFVDVDLSMTTSMTTKRNRKIHKKLSCEKLNILSAGLQHQFCALQIKAPTGKKNQHQTILKQQKTKRWKKWLIWLHKDNDILLFFYFTVVEQLRSERKNEREIGMNGN